VHRLVTCPNGLIICADVGCGYASIINFKPLRFIKENYNKGYTMIKKEIIIKLLSNLHAFQKLDKRIISIIGEVFKVDAFKLCDDNGITYNI